MVAVEKSLLSELRRRVHVVPPRKTPEQNAIKLEQSDKQNGQTDTEEKIARVRITSEPTDVHEFDNQQSIVPESDLAFIAFARVFSGKLESNSEMYLINADGKTEPTKVKLGQLYTFMGRELNPVDTVHAGNILGIAGLDEHLLCSGTLCSVKECPSLSPLLMSAEPIVRVSIEPSRPSQMPQLRHALKLLNQSDPCVRVILQDSGETVLITAGEVHLERCLSDIRCRFGESLDEIAVSEPIIPFMETIVPRPKMDMMNELIADQSTSLIDKTVRTDKDKGIKDDGLISISTSNKQAVFKIRAVALPEQVIKVLEEHSKLIEHMEKLLKPAKYRTAGESAVVDDLECSESLQKDMRMFRQFLSRAFEASWKKHRGDQSIYWGKLDLGATMLLVDQIWAFGGARRQPTNLLLNRIGTYQRLDVTSVWRCEQEQAIALRDRKISSCEDGDGGNVTDQSASSPNENVSAEVLRDWDRSVVTGFRMRCASGPLCEEPLHGVAFVLEQWTMDNTNQTDADTYGPMSGQIMAAVKEGCKQSFQAQPQRLVAAMYSCTIQATAEVLGKVYAVLAKREGRVISDDSSEGTNLFQVQAALPVIESFGFANEIRKRTSGLATPQLVFSHWEVIQLDPFWVPSTAEEIQHFGEKADSDNKARKYMNSVRRRKGLKVDEQIVEHAEKQRTLTKSK